MKTKEQKLALLMETAAFYCRNTLAQDNGTCVYYDPATGRRCAIGRICSLTEAKELARFAAQDGNLAAVSCLWPHVPKRLQDYGIEFLVELQKLHDYAGNWTETGLSDVGAVKRDRIACRITEGGI